jgi:two-component system, cell cycle sensor histidine kinase and response regulator CckA
MNQLIHILHLEDDVVDAELIQEKIEAAGLICQIDHVQTREEFDAALRQGGHDIILADFRLPLYDGMSALRLAQEVCPEIPFIFVSGTMGEEAVIEGLTEGATDYVLKQRLSRIAPAIRRALHEAENQRARRRAEEELRKLSRAVEQSASTIIITDTQGCIEYANPRFTDVTGYPSEEVLGQHTRFLKSGHTSPEEYKQLWDTITSGKEWHGEFQNVKKNGELYWESASISPIKNADGVITHFLAVKEDISDRKQAEAEREKLMAQIRQQAQEMQLIVDTVPEGIFLLSGDHRVRLTNPLAQKDLALLALDWEEGRLTHLGSHPLKELLTSPPKGLWHELESNGRYFEVIARPVEEGLHQRGWVFVIRDVTRERQIQSQVQSQERLAAVGQLAAGIAHDFNNTLAVIKLYGELLLRSAELSVRDRERLQTVARQTQRAADLIQQILDFSRQSLMDKQPLDLLPFLKELNRLLKRTLPENILVSLKASKDEYIIHADPSRIQQVILNLALNARDAMPQGGKLTISLTALELEPDAVLPVSGMTPGRWVQVAVSDNGTGMSSETLAHVFEPFFTTKERSKGTGLGLAQVYGIIQGHDGFIDVSTEVNRGTTFYLYFPAFAVEEYETPNMLGEDLPHGQGQLILVVEDDTTTRQALAESLDLLNYRVVEAGNGREALTLLALHGNEIDLVLSDAIMPEMGGIALFHALRDRNLAIPFVVITGHAMEKDIENLRALGLRGWLIKPPNLSQLAGTLQAI